MQFCIDTVAVSTQKNPFELCARHGQYVSYIIRMYTDSMNSSIAHFLQQFILNMAAN